MKVLACIGFLHTWTLLFIYFSPDDFFQLFLLRKYGRLFLHVFLIFFAAYVIKERLGSVHQV